MSTQSTILAKKLKERLGKILEFFYPKPLKTSLRNSVSRTITVSLFLVDILERDWRFRLGEEFRTTFGRNLGDSLMTIRLAGPNVLRCEEHHEERPEWRVTTTFEFYQLGIVRTYELPYENNLVAKKFYEKLSGGQKSGYVIQQSWSKTNGYPFKASWSSLQLCARISKNQH